MPESPGPDLRFLQANERTLLAWLRTGLALIGLGFVIARFHVWMRVFAHEAGPQPHVPGWLGVLFVGLGALTCALAGVQYVRIRRAIVAGQPLTSTGALGPALALLLTLLGGALAAYLALGSP